MQRKQQSKNHISQGKGKIKWRWHLLEWDERNAKKNETKVHKGSLILLPMVVPREAFDFWGKWGEI